jgi:hypothetical protein
VALVFGNNLISYIVFNGVFGIKDSMVSLLAPVQSMIKVVGDRLTTTIPDENYPSKKTLVKLIWVPKMYKEFVKGSIPDKNLKDLELDEYMIIIKDTFASSAEKIISDLNGVDNLLANVLNGCIGAGCMNGNVRPPIVLDKTIEIENNINKKENLENFKKNLESQK